MLCRPRVLFRRGWSAVLVAMLLGLLVSLLPGMVTREDYTGLCPCPGVDENPVQLVSRQKRDSLLQTMIPAKSAVSQGSSHVKKEDLSPSEPQTELPRLEVGKTKEMGSPPSKIATIRNATMVRKALSPNKTKQITKKGADPSDMIKGVTVFRGGGSDDQQTKALSKSKCIHTVTEVPPCSHSKERHMVSPVDYIMDKVLNSNLSKVERKTVRLLAQLEWMGKDILLFKNLTTFLAKRNRTRQLVPELLQGQENGCGKDPPFLLVFVPSVANHSSTRQAIRDTWASPAYGKHWPQHVNITQKVKVMFVFGRVNATENVLLNEEQVRYGDIVRADFADTYQNLTLKMLVALRWSAYFCPGAKFFVKVDEDTFVNIPVLLDLLTSLSTRHSRFIMGHRNYIPIVMRSGKWKVNKKDYPFDRYPGYVHGHSYVISGDVIKDIADTAPYVPVVPIEDAYVTGIMPDVLNVSRLHAAMFAETNRRVNPCEVMMGSYVSQTKFTAQAMLSLWKLGKSGRCKAWCDAANWTD